MKKTSQGLDIRLHEARQFRPENGQEGRPSAQPVGVAGHEAENKKLKAQIKELKGSGGAVSTSTVAVQDEDVSVQLEQEGKTWKVEFERLAKEKSALTISRDDLQ